MEDMNIDDHASNDRSSAENGTPSWHDSAGKFAKGNPGRIKGARRNVLRDEITAILKSNLAEFPGWFAELKPKEKIDVTIDLMPYGLARLQSISMTDSEGNDLQPTASFDYTKLSPSALREVLSLTKIHTHGE